jgi:hypothetical protein
MQVFMKVHLQPYVFLVPLLSRVHGNIQNLIFTQLIKIVISLLAFICVHQR